MADDRLRATDVPPPGDPAAYRLCLVCLGNICRSAMAEVVLVARLGELGLADRVRVRSAGTGDWHIGRPMDPRAAATLTAHGYDPTRHRAQQVSADWLRAPRGAPATSGPDDLVLAMDAQNLADLRALHPDASPERLRLFRDFDPDGPGEPVPDPYYGGDEGFEEVLAMVERTSRALAAAVARSLEAS